MRRIIACSTFAIAFLGLCTSVQPGFRGLALAAPGDGVDFLDPKTEYDRLDGTGPSHKRVDVIEWEGNLEVHVYPAGSLKGLAAKIDDASSSGGSSSSAAGGVSGGSVSGGSVSGGSAAKSSGGGRKVMVLAYRFDNGPDRQYVRRAILGIPIRPGFKAYRDPSADGYDKVILTNNTLGTDVASYRLEPEPTDLYPEGDTRSKRTQEYLAAKAGKKPAREPATSTGTGAASGKDGAPTSVEPPKATFDEETGSIKHFE